MDTLESLTKLLGYEPRCLPLRPPEGFYVMIAGDRDVAGLTRFAFGALLDRLSPSLCAELGIPRAAKATETTSHGVAAIASRGLRGETLSPEEVRAVCASALAQAADRAVPVTGGAERLLEALDASDCELYRDPGQDEHPKHWSVTAYRRDAQEDIGIGPTPLAALRAAFPEVLARRDREATRNLGAAHRIGNSTKGKEFLDEELLDPSA